MRCQRLVAARAAVRCRAIAEASNLLDVLLSMFAVRCMRRADARAAVHAVFFCRAMHLKLLALVC